MKVEQREKIATAIAQRMNARFPEQPIQNVAIAQTLATALDEAHGRYNFKEADDIDLADLVMTVMHGLDEKTITDCGPVFDSDPLAEADGNTVSEEERGALA